MTTQPTVAQIVSATDPVEKARLKYEMAVLCLERGGHWPAMAFALFEKAADSADPALKARAQLGLLQAIDRYADDVQAHYVKPTYGVLQEEMLCASFWSAQTAHFMRETTLRDKVKMYAMTCRCLYRLLMTRLAFSESFVVETSLKLAITTLLKESSHLLDLMQRGKAVVQPDLRQDLRENARRLWRLYMAHAAQEMIDAKTPTPTGEASPEADPEKE